MRSVTWPQQPPARGARDPLVWAFAAEWTGREPDDRGPAGAVARTHPPWRAHRPGLEHETGSTPAAVAVHDDLVAVGEGERERGN